MRTCMQLHTPLRTLASPPTSLVLCPASLTCTIDKPLLPKLPDAPTQLHLSPALLLPHPTSHGTTLPYPTAVMRAIDMLCLMLAPMAAGLLMTYAGMVPAVAVISLYSLAVWVPECMLLKVVHHLSPQLRLVISTTHTRNLCGVRFVSSSVGPCPKSHKWRAEHEAVCIAAPVAFLPLAPFSRPHCGLARPARGACTLLTSV